MSYIVRTNKTHGGKEFRSRFHLVGRVSPIQKREENGSYVDLPIYEVKKTRTGVDRRVLQFQVETAKSNRLKVELSGMEMENVYLYNSNDNSVISIPWKDRNDTSKYPPNYRLIRRPEWDLAKEFSQIVEEDIWVEVRGHFDFSEFVGDDGRVVSFRKRIIDSLKVINNGDEINVRGKKVNYVTDFDSPDFVEVNRLNMQVGIVSTYQEEDTKDTKINGVYLTYGKERSEPIDVELFVTYEEPKEGKMALADFFATFEQGDFIEIIGIDHNRAEFTWVDVELDDDDEFSNIDGEIETAQELVVSGSKKGIEVIGFIKGSRIKDFLTEYEIKKSFEYEDEDDGLDGLEVGEGEDELVDIFNDDFPF